MLVFRVSAEFSGGGFEDVGGRRASLRHAPSAGDRVAVQRQLRLSPCEAELTAIPRKPGASVIFQKQRKTS